MGGSTGRRGTRMKTLFRLLILGFITAAMACHIGCSGARRSSGQRHSPRNRGIRASSLDRGSFRHGRFSQKGVASYYGDGFHGKKTANGEIFDKNDMTAAHRTLAFDTRVKVTNLENGKRVIVRINDRGPYAKGRIIDLSEAAGAKIGLDKTGTARVKLQVLR